MDHGFDLHGRMVVEDPLKLDDGQNLTARMNTRAGNQVDALAVGQILKVGIDKKDVIIIPSEAS